jgi:hypothetical protein
VKVKTTTANPIEDLLDSGMTVPQLAHEWGYSSTASIGLLRNFEYVPPADRAAKMAATFGWKSAGVVIDYWAAKAAERKAANE